jgi:predicted outer membrane repeat protein
VANGDYQGPGNRDLDFHGKALTLRSENGPAETAIDCQAAGRGFDFHSGETADARLIGFTIKNGSADLGAGALFRSGSSPWVKDCRFTGGAASQSGGGVACLSGAAPVVSDCEFSGNSANFGGGVYCEGSSPVLERSTLSANSATSGGGLNCHARSAPRLTACGVRGNAAEYGGGIYADDSSPALMGCRLAGNSVLAGAAGFIINKSAPLFDRCIVMGNLSRGRGGGFCVLDGSTPRLVNCLLAGNSADMGGVLSGETPADTTYFINCTMTGNLGRSQAGGLNCNNGSWASLLNCVLWGNTPDSVCGAVITSLLDEDPRFARPGAFDFNRMAVARVGGQDRPMPDFIVEEGDYRLTEGSPAVDGGTQEGAPADDLLGGRRPCDGVVDLGAVEWCRPAVAPFLRGDANSDGRRDISDAGFGLNYLFLGGATPLCQESLDTDDSGSQDVSDAVYLLGNLFLGGPAPPEPAAQCGPDPTPDALGCASSPGCRGV